MIKGSEEVEQKVLEKIVPDKNDRLRLETTIEELTYAENRFSNRN